MDGHGLWNKGKSFSGGIVQACKYDVLFLFTFSSIIVSILYIFVFYFCIFSVVCIRCMCASYIICLSCSDSAIDSLNMLVVMFLQD